MKNFFKFILVVIHISFILSMIVEIQASYGQDNKIWHNKDRSIRYQPDGEDFVITNGTLRFNRAIYGTNTGFRIEAGDLPEFALYMPGMGGNLKFGLISEDSSKWLINAEQIVARYRPGSMLYDIKDSMLEQGNIRLAVLAMAEAEGFLVKFEFQDVPKTVNLFWGFGGATGKRFNRDGDIGADPESSFYLKPEYCNDNLYALDNSSFTLFYGSGKGLTEDELYEIQDGLGRKEAKSVAQIKDMKSTIGIVPPSAKIKLADARKQDSPIAFWSSEKSATSAVVGNLEIETGEPFYFILYNTKTTSKITYQDASTLFQKAEDKRKKLASRIKVNTPDPHINTFGEALSIAADAIWEEPSYLHGAVAWRMRLNGWRGIYAADPLGWHDRARKHFRSYAKSQLTTPEFGPVTPDTARNFARQKEVLGTAMFSSGYISRYPNGERLRAHHYDMNLVFIDALLRHFRWTGDHDFVKEMWPVLKRHLAWEKRNFDGDGDGLYDAYASIWASDAVQYSGGGVTHSSAYNYLANKTVAELAELIGEDATPFHNEAEKIYKAVSTQLWMSDKGWYAEYKDALGLKRLHPSAALWTIYHAIDSGLPDAFQAYQALRYVDTAIPHIPIKASGLPNENYFTLSTSSWMPYTWSVNNVALAEVLHTSLAYWQGGRNETAFKLWKSAFMESMYLSSSPGGFGQLPFYDAIRGELYRDFADPIGVAARTLVEGLFGIIPDVLNGTIKIHPGLPREWNHASLMTPNISFDFKRKQNKDNYTIIPSFPKPVNLKFQSKASRDSITSITVNGVKTSWTNVESAIGEPIIEINYAMAPQYHIEIEWQGSEPDKTDLADFYTREETFQVSFQRAKILEYFDPQKVLSNIEISFNEFNANIDAEPGHHTVFIKIRQGQLCWWVPLNFEVQRPIDIIAPIEQEKNNLKLRVHNYSHIAKNGKLLVNPGKNVFETDLSIQPESFSQDIHIPVTSLVTGSNRIRFENGKGKVAEQSAIHWDIHNLDNQIWEEIDLSTFFNDKVTNIFENQYLSPRSPYPTLQLPIQGIGNWCYTQVKPNIDDSGLRRRAGVNGNKIVLPQGIPFATPGDEDEDNIVFTSLWDNYPDEIVIPLSGKSNHAYFLMAGSTNPMQSRFTNGLIFVEYMDNQEDSLMLRNPETWWPIEQDYLDDRYAFTINAPKPIRVHLKTGNITRDFDDYVTIKGFTSRAIDGGAAIVLDLPLNPLKELKQIKLKTMANDVVIGLMSITLARE